MILPKLELRLDSVLSEIFWNVNTTLISKRKFQPEGQHNCEKKC